MLGIGTVLFVLASAAGIVAAASSAERRAHAALSIAEGRRQLTAISSLEWRAVAERRLSAQSDAQLTALTRQMWQTVSHSTTHDVQGEEGRRLLSSAMTYLRAAEDEQQALRRGDLVRALDIDRTRVDPAFAVFDARIANAAEQLHLDSERSSQRAGLLAGGTIPATALIVLVVWRREQRLRNQRLRAERDASVRFQAMVRNASDLIVITDAADAVTYQSPSVRSLLGLADGELVRVGADSHVHPADQDRLALALRRVKQDAGAAALVEFRVLGRTGSWLTLEAHVQNMLHDPQVNALVWNCRDVSERKALEDQLAHQAFHDSLTGLANRALLGDRVGQALLRLEREPGSVGVLVLDLDGFKDVNDSLGHSCGDQVLVEVATRLAGLLRPGDTAARLGGDEFAVLLAWTTDEQLHEVALRVIRSLAAPIALEQTTVRISASVGAITAKEATARAADLMRDADTAMYEAKRRGRAQVVRFEEAMRHSVRDRLELTADLQQALQQRTLAVAYQPLVDLRTRTLRGFEALARWQHPHRGNVAPDVFIPLAEESAMVVELDMFVLRTACAQVRRWQLEGENPRLGISVNVSGRHLSDPGLTADVRDALAHSGLPAGSLTLEITETAVVENPVLVAARLRELHGLGVRIAVDDFGTGYSSLAYLRQLPIDILKIDRSFVQQPHTQRDEALLKGVIALGQALELELVAEGIEQTSQLERVQLDGCQTGQGFLFARALSETDAAHLVMTGMTPPAPRSQATVPMNLAARP